MVVNVLLIRVHVMAVVYCLSPGEQSSLLDKGLVSVAEVCACVCLRTRALWVCARALTMMEFTC